MSQVIITGATGLVGSAAVRYCIEDADIAKIIVLTRNTVPKEVVDSAKVEVVQHDDFGSYPPALMDKLKGSTGCLWCIGGRATHFPDIDTYRKVQVNFAVAAAAAFVESLTPLSSGKPFSFVFCSGKYAEWDQKKSLTFLSETRKMKGEVEKKLCDLAAEHASRLQVWCVRPSGILSPDSSMFQKATGRLYDAISSDDVAKCMARVMVDSAPSQILENNEMKAFIASK